MIIDGKDHRCKICGNDVRVKCNTRKKINDKKILVVTWVRCVGKHRHTYPAKKVVVEIKPTGNRGGNRDRERGSFMPTKKSAIPKKWVAEPGADE